MSIADQQRLSDDTPQDVLAKLKKVLKKCGAKALFKPDSTAPYMKRGWLCLRRGAVELFPAVATVAKTFGNFRFFPTLETLGEFRYLSIPSNLLPNKSFLGLDNRVPPTLIPTGLNSSWLVWAFWH
jgi:hypothetical protein